MPWRWAPQSTRDSPNTIGTCNQSEPVPAGHVQETFLNAWQASEDRQPIQFKDKENRDDMLAQGIALLELYMQEPPPQNIVAIEEPLMVPLFTSDGQCLERPLVAVLDLLHRNDQDRLTVSEYKTSGRRYSELEAEMMSKRRATCMPFSNATT